MPTGEPENLAYLIYTSGSTGRPKAVALTQRSAVALVRWARRTWSAEELSGVLFATSVGFDLSVFELFVPLAWGGRVILAENALALPSLPAAGEVTLVNTVPSAMAELVRQGALPAGVRTVNLAGEALPRPLVEALYGLTQIEKVWNLYGPSEDTTYSTAALLARSGRGAPEIGRPLAGTRAYVLGRDGQPAPWGVPGELCLGGAGLARGYFGRPDLTAERFVPDSGMGGKGEAGARLYRTGDLARWRSSGEIEFLGRLDHQVKVRGFRIELGEVEMALLAQPGVGAAAVLLREDHPGDPRLVAYVEPSNAIPGAVSGALPGALPAALPGALRAALRLCLPEHMVPGAIVVLARLPLSPNGKLDRRALARLAPETAGDAAHVAPQTPSEEVVAGIWAQVLRREQVGAEEDFFALGGHSLLATQVISRLREAFGVEVPLRALFERPTVRDLAAAVERSRASEAPALRPAPRGRELPLSFAQERLWFLDRLRPGSSAYNLPATLRLSGPLDIGALASTWEALLSRHEALRTTFALADGRPVQVIAPPHAGDLPLIDLEGLPAARRERGSPSPFGRGGPPALRPRTWAARPAAPGPSGAGRARRPLRPPPRDRRRLVDRGPRA